MSLVWGEEGRERGHAVREGQMVKQHSRCVKMERMVEEPRNESHFYPITIHTQKCTHRMCCVGGENCPLFISLCFDFAEGER